MVDLSSSVDAYWSLLTLPWAWHWRLWQSTWLIFSFRQAIPVIYLVLFFFIVAVFLFGLSNRQRKSTGIPGGRLIYADTRAWGPVAEPLFDPELGLTGKPDYLVEQGNQIIPVEVKTRRPPDNPFDTHIFQLAAYCLLVDRIYGKRPPHGILHYTSESGAMRTFSIDYTHELEMAILNMLDELRAMEHHKEVNRSHNSTKICQSCGYRSICDQRLD
jgi:CRISPR-associated exonuclease Cas4